LGAQIQVAPGHEPLADVLGHERIVLAFDLAARGDSKFRTYGRIRSLPGQRNVEEHIVAVGIALGEWIALPLT